MMGKICAIATSPKVPIIDFKFSPSDSQLSSIIIVFGYGFSISFNSVKLLGFPEG